MIFISLLMHTFFFIYYASIVPAKCQGAGNINNLRLWGVTVHITVLKQPAKGCKYNSVNKKEQIRRERLAGTYLPFTRRQGHWEFARLKRLGRPYKFAKQQHSCRRDDPAV